MKSLKFGDLIVFKDSIASQNVDRENVGVVYDVKGETVQILHAIPARDENYSRLVKVSGEDLLEGSLPGDYIFIADQISSLQLEYIIQKIGQLNLEKIDEILRKLIHNVVIKHYEAIHKRNEDFIPGKTYIHYAGRVYDEKEMTSLVDSALDFWLTGGRFARQFEQELAEFLGVKYCILTNSGSSANLLAISALTSPKLGERRLKPGDEVITVACAFPTTVNPIIQNNLIPVFIDVDIETFNIQATKIEAALSEKTKAIFLAHTLGNPFDIEAVVSVAQKYNLWLVEDNCDALGSTYNGRFTGTFGDISTFSFYPPHHITMGEGGALVINDGQLKRIIESFRDWGRDCWCESGHDNTCGKRFNWRLGNLPYGYDHKYIYSHIGYNLKATDMQAAVGVQQLKKLQDFIEARKKNWRAIYKELKRYEEYLILPKKTDNSSPSWFGFPLTVRENAPFSKNEMVDYLEENKIATRMLFSGNIVCHPSFENIKYRIHDSLKNTDFIMHNTFWIGVYPGLNKKMIDYIIHKFHEFFRLYNKQSI